jgi:hypothetical protein
MFIVVPTLVLWLGTLSLVCQGTVNIFPKFKLVFHTIWAKIHCKPALQTIKQPRYYYLFFYVHTSCTVLLRCRGFSFFSLDLYTIDSTPWTSDGPVARPAPKYRTTQTQNKRTRTRNIHAPIGVRTHDDNVRATEDSSCLRLLGYRDRPFSVLIFVNIFHIFT